MSRLWSDRTRRLSREGTWIAAGQGLTVLGALVGVRLLTGQLEPAAYGELALGMTLSTLLNQTLLGALGSGVIRFYAPAAERSDLGGYLRSVRNLVAWTTWIALVLVAVGVAALLVAGNARWIPLTVAAATYALFAGYGSFLNAIQNAARQRAIVAAHQALDAWARGLLALALTMWLGATSTNAMIGYATASVVVVASQYAFFRMTLAPAAGDSRESTAWRESMLEYSWPFAAWGVFTWAQQASDRWALELYASTEDVGVYSLLYQLGYYPVAMMTGMVVQFVSPVIFQRAGDGTDTQRNASVSLLARRLTAVALVTTAAAFVVALGFHREVFALLAAEEYGRVSHLLPWILLGGGLFAAGQTIALNLLSQMKARQMIVSKIVTALAGCALNFIGAYAYGVTGVVIAGVMFSGIYLTWMLRLSNGATGAVTNGEVPA